MLMLTRAGGTQKASIGSVRTPREALVLRDFFGGEKHEEVCYICARLGSLV